MNALNNKKIQSVLAKLLICDDVFRRGGSITLISKEEWKVSCIKLNDAEFLLRKLKNYHMTQTDTNLLARTYGLVKIHKNRAPLRPIVSHVGILTHQLAKVVHNVLKRSSPKPSSYVKNSLDLINLIKHLHIPTDHTLISLGVACTWKVRVR